MARTERAPRHKPEAVCNDCPRKTDRFECRKGCEEWAVARITYVCLASEVHQRRQLNEDLYGIGLRDKMARMRKEKRK